MKTINKEGIVFGLCTPEVQAALEQAYRDGHTFCLYGYEGWREWNREVILDDPEFKIDNTYKAEIPDTKLIPWQLHEFMGKYIRHKGVMEDGSPYGFQIVDYIDDDDCVSNNTDFTRSIRWWLENGECLREDGTIGPCGKEISE